MVVIDNHIAFQYKQKYSIHKQELSEVFSIKYKKLNDLWWEQWHGYLLETHSQRTFSTKSA